MSDAAELKINLCEKSVMFVFVFVWRPFKCHTILERLQRGSSQFDKCLSREETQCGKAFRLFLWKEFNADLGGVFRIIIQKPPFFQIQLFFLPDGLLFASRIYWNSINSILPSICNLSYSIGTNTNPNHDGSQLDRCSFHEILGYVFPPNIPSCSLQPEFILISLQDWFLECISLDWPFFFFFCKLVLWNSVARMQQRVSLTILQ